MKYSINSNFSHLEEFLLNIKNHFVDSEKSIHKARNEIKVIRFGGVELVVKSFKVPNLFNRFVYSYIRSSKAKKSYDYANRISHFTPQAIGYIEFYEYSLLTQSFFVSEKFEYDFSIREPLTQPNFTSKTHILKEFAKFTYALHEEGILHLDFSPGNILVKKGENGYIFKIVDINRMKFGEISMKNRLKNFSKLWAKDEDLEIIAREYAKMSNLDADFAVNRSIYYSRKNKFFKNLKKRAKGIKVVD